MNATLAAWNAADEATALQTMLACCGSKRWAEGMVALRPIGSVQELSTVADHMWITMREPDWLEAFASHPQIGDRKPANESGQSAEWSKQEQSQTNTAGERVMTELTAANELYRQRFGFNFIVCATGKSAEEMLAILQRRLANKRDAELREAAEQQRQIMQIRLGKWLIE